MKNKWLGVLGIFALVVLVSGCVGYSEGDRAGTVTKFSNKGIIWKTWEGQVNLGGLSYDGGANIWEFSLDNHNKYSVDNPELIDKLQNCVESGQRCKVTYKQELIVAPWRAGTGYIVTDVEGIE